MNEAPGTLLEHRTCRHAKMWLAIKQTTAWIRDQNYKGIALSSDGLLSHFRASAKADVVDHIGQNDRNQRRLAETLRTIVDIRIGALQVQEPISDDDVQFRAGLSNILQRDV